MKKIACTILAALMLPLGPLSAGEAKEGKEDQAKQEVKKEELEKKRSEIDAMARESLDRLFIERPEAKDIDKKSYGHAVFDTTKIALGLSGGGGGGVAVSKDKRLYMRMATAGVGVGLGAQNYQLVLFFDDKATFDHFTSEGWNAEASADAGAGARGSAASETPARGITIFKLADKGLIANADISGTRFWAADRLNQ